MGQYLGTLGLIRDKVKRKGDINFFKIWTNLDCHLVQRKPIF